MGKHIVGIAMLFLFIFLPIVCAIWRAERDVKRAQRDAKARRICEGGI